jgi:hypothetical protein
MTQIDVPSPTLRSSERDLSMPLPPDVRPSICLAQPFLPMLTNGGEFVFRELQGRQFSDRATSM